MDEKYGMLRKGMIVLAIPFVLQLIFLSILLKSQFDNASSQQLAIHTKDVIADEEGLSKRLVMLRNNVLGLAMSGNLGLNPFDSLADTIQSDFDALKGRVQDNEAQAAGSTPCPTRSRSTSTGSAGPTRCSAPIAAARRWRGSRLSREVDAGRDPARPRRVSAATRKTWTSSAASNWNGPAPGWFGRSSWARWPRWRWRRPWSSSSAGGLPRG